MAFSLNKSGKKALHEECWKYEHIVGNKFTVVLLDIPIRKASHLENDIFNYLTKVIEKAGLTSYVICSAVSKIDEKELKKLGLTEYYTQMDSGWYEDIVVPARAKGMIVENTIAFGPALYQIIKTGNDFTVQDLYFPFLENYFYLGHGFEGDYGMFDHLKVKDMFVWPQFPLMNVFVPGYEDGVHQVELGCWMMNFLVSVCQKISTHQYKLPRNMEPCRLHELIGYEEIKKFLEEHKGFDSVAFDLETSGFDFINDKIRCIQLAFDEIDGYYIEWKEFEDHPDLIQILSDMLLSIPNRITQNGKFDIKFLWQNGVSREVIVTEDAMEMAHVLCSQRKKGLKTQSYYYTPYGGYDHQLDEYVKKQKKIRKVSDIPYSTIPKKILFPYSTMDPIMTFRTYIDTKIALEQFAIRFPTEKPIEHTGGHASTPYEWYKLYVMGLYPIICDTEFEGMCVDTEVMDKHRAILQEWEAEDRKKLVEIWKEHYGMTIPEDYPFTSQQKLGQLLEESGWACHGVSENDHVTYSTNEEAFTEWARDKMPGVEELIHLRQSVNGYHTYIGTMEKVVDQRKGTIKEKATGWLQFIRNHPDGTVRMHCNFGVCLNETFRCRSSEPNFQNIPTRGKIAPLVKQCITTPVAAMYYVTGESGKEYELTEIDSIRVKNHPSGQEYIEARFLTENDTIDESDPNLVIKEYD